MKNAIWRGCAAIAVLCATASLANAQVTVTNADNGKTVSVKQGEPLVIELTGKHEDGRYWLVDVDPTPQLILSGRTTASVAVPEAPETTSFTYTTGDVGQVVFRASYVKTGSPVPKESDVSITVDVTPGTPEPAN
jgi:predicted secreted protein